MDVNHCNFGVKVKTNEVLGSTAGMLIASRYIQARTPNEEGEIVGYVAGHGGDVWWVKHTDGTIAAYSFDEMEEVESDS